MTDSNPAPSSVDVVDSLDDVVVVADHHDAVISEALGVIDGALGRMSSRDVLSSNEVADLLLDVRTLLTQSASESAASSS